MKNHSFFILATLKIFIIVALVSCVRNAEKGEETTTKETTKTEKGITIQVENFIESNGEITKDGDKGISCMINR